MGQGRGTDRRDPAVGTACLVAISPSSPTPTPATAVPASCTLPRGRCIISSRSPQPSVIPPGLFSLHLFTQRHVVLSLEGKSLRFLQVPSDHTGDSVTAGVTTKPWPLRGVEADSLQTAAPSGSPELTSVPLCACSHSRHARPDVEQGMSRDPPPALSTG